jgi:inorganic pyrophosphatase
MHLWHDVPMGEQFPEIFEAIVEIPAGSKVKYEIDKATGLVRVDRILSGSLFYPFNYGIVPQTMGPDGDPYDILVLTDQSFAPGSLMTVKPVGIMRMVDQGIDDDKVLVVHVRDPKASLYAWGSETMLQACRELRLFFENYTRLEGKTVTVPSFEGPEAAIEALLAAKTRYDGWKDEL